MKKWNLNSWSKYPAKHLPVYQDKRELELVLSKVKKYPPLVFAGETRSLKKSLADVVDGKAFLLQGGDCAESFAEFHPDNIRDTFKVLLQMSLVMTASASVPVVAGTRTGLGGVTSFVVFSTTSVIPSTLSRISVWFDILYLRFIRPNNRI